MTTQPESTWYTNKSIYLESQHDLPNYSQSRSRNRSDSQSSFVTNHSNITTTSIDIANERFQNNYKKLPAKLRTHNIAKYRKSVSRDSTQIQSLQLVTPRSCSKSNTPSRDRALCGSSLIGQTRRQQSKYSTLTNYSNANLKRKQIMFRDRTINLKQSKNSRTREDRIFSLHEWLSSMDILDYKHIFISEGYDKLGAIMELTMRDLREMCIPKGHAKMILRQVRNLQIKFKHDTLHTKQSYSDPIIPSIAKILSFDDEYSDTESESERQSDCGFPDIDSSVIDMNKINAFSHHSNDNHTVHTGSDCTAFHTFPRTSTNTSPFPLNKSIKNNNKSLQLLSNINVNIAKPNHRNTKHFNYKQRQYKKKKKKSNHKNAHFKSKSNPLMSITTTKKRRNNWFLCGSKHNQKKEEINIVHTNANANANDKTEDITPEFIPTNRTLSISESDLEMQFDIPTNINMEILSILETAKEYHRIGNVIGAAEKYSEFLHYYCDNVDVRIRYALCLLDLEEYILCKEQLDLLLTYDANNGKNNMLHFVYALLYHKCNNFVNAIKHYNCALMYGYVEKDRIFNNLASLFKQCKDYSNAEKYQILAIKANNTNYISYINYAKILSDMHRFNEATQAYQSAISVRPDLDYIYIEFAMFLMHIKRDYLLAATQLNIAHKMAPNNVQIKDLLSQAIEYCAGTSDSSYNGSESRFTECNDSNSKQRRQSICESLPPPHNPNNPNNLIRKQFSFKLND